MNNSDLFGGENILEQDLLDNSLLFDSNSEELSLITSTESGILLSSESEEFIESVLGERENEELHNNNQTSFPTNTNNFNYSSPYGGNLELDVTGIVESEAVVSAEASHSYSASNFAIIAEGTVKVNGKSDFDGEPLDPSDDAFIYGGKGFRINGKPVLPVQRDEAGNVLEDESHRQILVDNAVAVSEDYHVAKAGAGSRLYSGLTPPQIVETQTVEVPAFAELVDHKLSKNIPDGSHEIHLDLRHIWIENQRQWEANFSAPGTVDNPTVVRVKNGSLDIPKRVDLSNYVIIVEHGNINFKGKDQDLDNVTLVAENGNIDLGKVNANDSTFLASKSIRMNRNARFAGDSLIANGQGNINFNGATTTTDETDNLVVISAGNITFNGATDTRGQFLATRNFRFNGRSTLYGSIGAKHDIVFNGKSKVIADTIPHVLVEDITVVEGDTGTQDAVITLNLSQPSIFGIEVDYGTKDGTAVAGEDYQAVNGTVHFSPLKTKQTIVVPINGDTIDELDEAFTIEFTKVTQASLAQKQSTVTILDDDNDVPIIDISLDDVSVQEGDSDTNTAEFTVTLSGSSTLPIAVDFSTENGIAITGQDYLATSGTLTFEPGETVKTIQVPIVGDTLDEVDKDFLVNLTNPINAAIADSQGQGTIVDDDEAPGVSIDDVSIVEGDEGLQQIEFTVSLAQASGKTISVDYSSVDGTAIAGEDYQATSGTLTFEPGETSKTITVDVVGDTLDEPDEAFSIQLANLVNASATDDIGTGTIIDDDVTVPEIAIAIDDVSVAEGDEETGIAEFTVTLSGTSTSTITVDYSTENDSAIADIDYLAANGTLTFEPGETVKTIQVPIVGDTLDEVDKDFLVNLTNPNNAIIADEQSQGTIVDDDEAPGVSINDVSVIEGDEGLQQVEFTVSLAQASGKTISVDYISADGTALAGVDYEAVAGTLTFEPGETSKTITVDVVGDTLDEPDEAFSIQLANLVNVTVADETGTGTIIDDDDPVNNAPEITSTPDTVFNIETGIYEYDVDAVDPDNDELTYSLIEAPEGMTIDATTGVISWQPDTIPFDSIVPVEVRVEDGNGGFDIQEYQIDVPEPVLLGQIRGLKWEDFNKNSIRDGLVLSGEIDLITNSSQGYYNSSIGDLYPGSPTDPLASYFPAPNISTGDPTADFSIEPDISAVGELGDWLDNPELAISNGFWSDLQSIPQRWDVNTETAIIYEVDGGEYGIQNFTADFVIDNSILVWVNGEYRFGAGNPPGFEVENAPLGDLNPGKNYIQIIRADYGFISNYLVQITGNRIDQIAEPGLAGVSVYLDLNNNGVLDANEPVEVTAEDDLSTTNIDETGQYSFTDLFPGTYIVREILPEDFEQTAPLLNTNQDFYTVEIGESETVSDIDFGNVALNNAPLITSTPDVVSVNSGINYTYDVEAIDLDGDSLSYQLVEPPQGMTINEITGVIEWTPSFAQIDSYEIQILVTDGQGGETTQTYSLEVAANPVNQAPVISSEPIINAVFGNPYTYDVEAVDPDGEAITYSLNNAPDGMVIDGEGVITWNPTAADLGNYAIEVVATDGRGISTTQTYDLSVTEDTQAPEINFEFTDTQVNIGGDITFTISAIDNVGVENVSLEVNGNPVVLDPQGMATVTFNETGQFEVIARAVDDAGNVSESTQTIFVLDPNDTQAPVVDLISYIGGTDFNTEITAPTRVLGTVTDDNLLFYTLSVAPLDNGEFREIFRGTDTANNGNIGTFDPSIFLNDAYRLQLSATDAGGNTATDEAVVNVAGDLKLGNFQLSFTDMTIPVTGIPIQVTRTYDSFNANNTDDFGFGWRLEFRDTDLRTSLGEDPELTDPDGFGIPSKAFRDEEKVYITLPGGERETFIFRPQRESRFSSFFEPIFEADEGVTSTLTVSGATLAQQGNEYFNVGLAGSPYNPADPAFGGGIYTLTSKEGIQYRINGLTGDLETVTDRNGNVLTFTDNGISSSTGKNVTFERDTQGRIERVIDPEGNAVRYGYDAAGDLVSVTDREGNVTQFDYDEQFDHYLDEVIDPLGRSGVRSEYDDLGRLRQLIDADGNPVELIYDPDNSIQQVEDQLGNVTTFEYDDRGNVLRETDPDGGIITRSYDGNNNVLTQTDANNLTTTFTYDGNRNILTESDPLGNTVTYTYDNFSNILTTEDASGIIVTNTYNPDNGNLTQISGQPNGTLTFSYDASGNIESFNDANGSTAFTYDVFGNISQQTDAENTVTTFEYDNNGNTTQEITTRTLADGTTATLVTLMEYDDENRLTKVTDAEGNVTETIYNSAGERIEQIDALGRSTKYIYDDRGLLIETILPDGTPGNDNDNPRMQTEYDAEGQVIAEIDELGRRTEYRYDDLGRQIATIFPDNTPGTLADNPQTQTEYDAAGRRIAELDERGNRTTFIYDDAGRVIETILPDDTPGNDADNPRFPTTYDVAGRPLTQTDAEDNVTTSSYDSLGRPEEQEFADGTTATTEYDLSGRVVARTDQDGEVTRFEYDDLGRLTAVIDPLGTTTPNPDDFRTEYGYDEQGNLISQTDANGNVTNYEYDNLGRRIAVVLLEGQRSTMSYDEVGNLTSMTDFNGVVTTYSYDERDRLTSESFSDDTPSITHTYFDNGLKATVTNERGITRFTYDVRNRLTSRIEPDGTTIAYSYDIAGNRTEVTIPSGDTTYTYDAQNRIKTVADPDNGITEYFYSPNSNLERTEFANGTVETREYDDLNRLTYLQTTDSNVIIISSFRYTLDAEGNRTQVEEQDGRIVQYEYDDNDRLTQESIFAPGATVATQTIEYAYDEVGNRLSRVDSAEGTTIYTYDNNDRLQSETTDGAETTYTYDSNGNTITKTTAGNTVTYDWDAKNRLVAADTDGDGTNDVVNQYNEDGIRVSQTFSGEETRFLIDENRPFAQVLEEYTEGGIIQVSYVHGNDLIYQDRDGDRSFYHVDGLGSTRALTNEIGILTDSYIYDAFGNVLTQTGRTENSYFYAGEQRDSNLGLDYLRARYLDTTTGRFISRDSFEGFQNNPISLNKYAYASANPIVNIDPSGFVTLPQVVVAAGLIGFISDVFRIRSFFKRITRAEDIAEIYSFTSGVRAWNPSGFGFGRQRPYPFGVQSTGTYGRFENISTSNQSILQLTLLFNNDGIFGETINYDPLLRDSTIKAWVVGDYFDGKSANFSIVREQASVYLEINPESFFAKYLPFTRDIEIERPPLKRSLF